MLKKLQTRIESKKKNKVVQLKPEEVEVAEELVDDDKPLDDEAVIQEEEINEPTLPIGGDFQILGEDRRHSKVKAKRVLPSWLEYPNIISNDLSTVTESIDELTFISPEMKTNLLKMNVKHLFPVQRSVVPWLLEAHSKPSPFRPRDLCVSAPTGSGKTIAFALPIVEILKTRVVQKVRALIVLPVRELASQVFTVINNLCRGTRLNCCLLSSKKTFQEEQHGLVKMVNGKLYSKVDIIVTTAGRLVEHLHSTKGFSLKDLKFLVIDEADRVMDQIQNDWLYHLDNHVKKESDCLFQGNTHVSLYALENTRPVHKLLFSATLSSDPEKLESMKLFRPKLFTAIVTDFKYQDTSLSETRKGEFVGKFTTPLELTEKSCETELRLKPLTLFSLIKENNWKRFLCFTNNNDSAHRLAFVLRKLFEDEMEIEELSSNLNKNARNSMLYKFSAGKINGLVSSDTLARGMDLPNVDVVLSYDCPRHIKTYVHRIGRTARAGKLGTAITLITDDDKALFNRILKDMGKESIGEIRPETDIEERSAKKYANVLEELQKYLLKENKLKTIKKLREENSAKVTTESKSSLLGMLQQQMQERGETKNPMDISKLVDKQDRKRKKLDNKNRDQAKKAKQH